MSSGRRISTAVCVLLLVAALPACSSSAGSPSGRLQVVTSTDVYGDIVHAIAGEHAEVTSFIDNPAQDPHSFEASARNQLAISKADLIVENGGGYDDFVARMAKTSAKSSATVLNVVQLSGRTAPAGGELNEHVWYDLAAVLKLVTRLRGYFSAQDPAHRADFVRNSAAFSTGLRALQATETAIRAADSGAGVAITEPVPLYLLAACGLVNKTPAAFSAAIEAGNDVSTSVLKQTLELFSTHAVRLLVYNEQTSGAETNRVLAAAKTNHVPTVPVTETLPSDEDYLTWMRANLAAVRTALAS